MTKWSISARQRTWLVEQLDRWQAQQVVSSEQATRVLGLYDSPAELADEALQAAARIDGCCGSSSSVWPCYS